MAKKKQTKVPKQDGGAVEEFDSSAFEEAKEIMQELDTHYGEQDDLFDEFEHAYLVDWKDTLPKRQSEDDRLTISPDITNKLIGAQRLLTATQPDFSMPFEDNDAQAQQASAQMEKAARLMWAASGRMKKLPIEIDLVLSALMFAEVHLGIVNLAEQLAIMPDSASKWERARLEAAVEMSPYLFECYHPRQGRALEDRLGLVGYGRKYKIKPRALKTEWPGVDWSNFDLKHDQDEEVIDWYDGEWRIAYLNRTDAEPFFMKKHGLPFIPVVYQITEGSQMFSKPEERARGFLYTTIKTEMHKRANLSLTALYNAIFGFATNPMFIHKKPPNNPDKVLTVDYGRKGGVIELEPGEEFIPLTQKGAIDPALLQGLEIAQQKVGESTIYDQALGEPLGSDAPFSMVALLHQAGRLPLVSPQKMSGWAAASGMEMAFKWIKVMHEEGTLDDLEIYDKDEGLTLGYLGDKAIINPELIPDRFMMEAKFDIDLPTDKLQQANAAQIFVNNGLASKRWIRENLLSIGASNEMEEEIWGEQMAGQMAMQFFGDQQRREMQQREAEMQAKAKANGGGGDGRTPGQDATSMVPATQPQDVEAA